MNKFLDAYNQSKLNHLNRPVKSYVIEALKKQPPYKEEPKT
jgi:hypothetical protein